MRLGANVHVAGQNRNFVRIKRPQNSLLDGEERSLADTEIRADLGGIEREAFSTMFSLDDITLEKGGENILASKGDLGQLLFSASAGLSDLSRQLLANRVNADGFYKTRGRSSQLSERTRAMTDAQKAADEWDAKWSDLCSACWLGEAPVLPDVDAVSGILHVLEKLASAIETRDGLIDRIEKMEKDNALFEASVFELCDSLEIRKTASLTELTRTIGDRIKAAERGLEQQENLSRDLARRREDERELLVTKEILDVQIAKMTGYFCCATLDEVEAFIDLSSKRQALRSSITELEQELVEITGANHIGDVEEKLASVNREELEGQLALLTPILEDQDRKCHDVFHERSTVQKAIDAIGGDSVVAEIEEQRRTILLEIEERAGRYLELRAGITAAEQALRLYRDRHRSGMMTRASDAFKTISRGAYTGVAAQPGKDGEVLIAVSANGGSKAADELSKGARFQLYLALRVAGYHEFVANRAPIPFIADDIMETFDDFRAEEAFRLFAEMAGHGQVIYLTHHQHLTEIARKVCPGVRLHDLESIQSTATLDGIAAE
ncbi:AAA family ATPase [Rhizobium sp. NZLR8]|uniref:AAA family ATPase n=1 Tax=Rhizobium sp. NZLR8 TaxID=2731104 RepID=UPI001C829CDB|nr:AAA family ATPase [Rhizobium sp. NZLR8]